MTGAHRAWTAEELAQKLRDAVLFAYGEAFIDNEISAEEVDGSTVLTQYDLETNEAIARFELGSCVFTRMDDASGAS